MKKLISPWKLDDLRLLFRAFGDHPFSAEWMYAVLQGVTIVYDARAVLNWRWENDFCVVSSGSINNERFPKAMLKRIKELIAEYPHIVIQSDNMGILSYMTKHGFNYDNDTQCYVRKG